MTNTHALRALVGKLIPYLTWRHHGIGALQAYVRENVEPEVRVHIWDPRLVRPGIEGHGDTHDHRFDLESTVLCGELIEMVMHSHVDAIHDRFFASAWDVWQVENARSAGPARGFDGECVRVESTRLFLEEPRVHRAGTTYTLKRGVFHRTTVEKTTVTVCTMREKRGQARILVPTGTEPVHAFGGPPLDTATKLAVLLSAKEALGVP